MTEKLFTYALGRGLAYYDMPTVRAIVRDAAAHDYRFSSIVLGIVNSTPFQKRMKTAQESRIRPSDRRRERVRPAADCSRRRPKELATMFITKMSLPRRTFLRGVGVTLALPLLESMVPAFTATAKTAANPTRRFGAIFVPLGERPGFWTPKTVGRGLRVLADSEAARAVPRPRDDGVASCAIRSTATRRRSPRG